jgi:hypothetical protein
MRLGQLAGLAADCKINQVWRNEIERVFMGTIFKQWKAHAGVVHVIDGSIRK